MDLDVSLQSLQFHWAQAVNWFVGWLLTILQVNGILIELGTLW